MKTSCLYIIICVFASAMLCVGCNSGNYAGDAANISPRGWAYTDRVVFVTELPDSVVEGSLELFVRHDNSYLYRNLFLEVALDDGERQLTDTVNLILADRFGGWQGRGIGSDFQFAAPVHSSVKLHSPVKVSIRHIMRTDTLQGINLVGYSFTKH